MGKIIHYDFRKETRKQEMEELQARNHEILMNVIKEKRHFTEEEHDEIKKINKRVTELRYEESKWGGKDRWEESY